MLGAAIGDIIGSRFEWNNYKATDFELFTPHNKFTDDTVCTVAVAEWALSGFQLDLPDTLRKWGNQYRNAGYGGMFCRWLNPRFEPQPYNSWGNGSAMRVSAVGWLCEEMESVLEYAKRSADITHNHPEGIKGVQAVACAIFLARKGENKAAIKQFIEQQFGYNLNRSCDDIRPHYDFDVSCQSSVPSAIIAFLESENFEQAVRLLISLGGDSDTLAAITGSIAEAFYGIPEEFKQQAKGYLPDEMLEVLERI